jgi:hypothetical protein
MDSAMASQVTKKADCPRCGQERVVRLLDGHWMCSKCQRETVNTAPATKKQLEYLAKLGVCVPSALTRLDAHNLIDAVVYFLPAYVADVWREMTNKRLDECAIPWGEAKRIAAIIATRDHQMAIDLMEVNCDRYFAAMNLANEMGVAMADCHLPVERDHRFEFVANILHLEWNRYRPSLLKFDARWSALNHE